MPRETIFVGCRPQSSSSRDSAVYQRVPTRRHAERHEAFTYWDYVATNYIETRAQSRSVMLLYVLGCTRTTLIQPTSFCFSWTGSLSGDWSIIEAAWSEGIGESYEPES